MRNHSWSTAVVRVLRVEPPPGKDVDRGRRGDMLIGGDGLGRGRWRRGKEETRGAVKEHGCLTHGTACRCWEAA